MEEALKLAIEALKEIKQGIIKVNNWLNIKLEIITEELKHRSNDIDNLSKLEKWLIISINSQKSDLKQIELNISSSRGKLNKLVILCGESDKTLKKHTTNELLLKDKLQDTKEEIEMNEKVTKKQKETINKYSIEIEDIRIKEYDETIKLQLLEDKVKSFEDREAQIESSEANQTRKETILNQKAQILNELQKEYFNNKNNIKW